MRIIIIRSVRLFSKSKEVNTIVNKIVDKTLKNLSLHFVNLILLES